MLQFRLTVHRNIFVRDLLITIVIHVVGQYNSDFGIFPKCEFWKYRMVSILQETKTITATVIVTSYDAENTSEDQLCLF